LRCDHHLRHPRIRLFERGKAVDAPRNEAASAPEKRRGARETTLVGPLVAPHCPTPHASHVPLSHALDFGRQALGEEDDDVCSNPAARTERSEVADPMTAILHGNVAQVLKLSALLSLLAGPLRAAPPAPITTLDGRNLGTTAIDERVQALMKANHVTGLALALVRDGRVAYCHAYGLRNVEENLPVTPDTILYGASLTKATFAYMVMQLVDQHRIDLDRPVADYLPKPLPEYDDYADLASDARWRKLTMRMLLSHTSGFSNFRALTREGFDPKAKLTFYFDPGSRFAYSGEGLLLAQRVLERGLRMDVGAEMKSRVFDRFGMTRTSMTWRDDFSANLAQGYTIEGRLREHDHRDHVSAAGSMDTTVTDWSRFLAGVVRGEGLTPASKAEMIREQIRIHSAAQFPTLSDETTHDYDGIELGYGLGWGVFETPFGHAFFKEGHDDGTANYALCVERRQACILLMSNSVRAEGVFKPLSDDLMGDTRLPWKWENYIPYDEASHPPPRY
jgi:CubicO group peptidase (beta-lactamase class C family)